MIDWAYVCGSTPRDWGLGPMGAKYTIDGGQAGKRRLDVLSRVCAAGTTALLDRVGLARYDHGANQTTIMGMPRVVQSRGAICTAAA